MKHALNMFGLLALLLAAASVAEQPPQPSELQAINVNTPETRLITAGQPTAADLAKLKAMGVSKVINLRSQQEPVPFDEKALVESLGMEYESLPIAGADDVTETNARRLDALLVGDDKVFLHCASSNRVGALLALRAHLEEGLPPEKALAEGKAAGLGSLEKRVKEVLKADGQDAQDE